MPEHKLRVIWSPESESDLLVIWHQGATHFSSEIADAHVRDIVASASRLQENPSLGRLRDDLMQGVRAIVVYPTVVFYRVTMEAIQIIRVVDGRRNLAAIFSHDADKD